MAALGLVSTDAGGLEWEIARDRNCGRGCFDLKIAPASLQLSDPITLSLGAGDDTRSASRVGRFEASQPLSPTLREISDLTDVSRRRVGKPGRLKGETK